MDKREISLVFRTRLKELIQRRGESLSAFSRRCGLDRSALSQFLDEGIIRLPRAETLFAIARTEAVSVDWLLGITQDEERFGEVASLLNIETGTNGEELSPLTVWHKEAEGYKIRYAPSSLPDLFRTKAVAKFEFGSQQADYADVKAGLGQKQLDYNRLPETDMEVVMPFQRLVHFANGADVWEGLAGGVRQAQIHTIRDLLDELYPTFRLFLYDGAKHFSAPFTVFGPKRVAVYVGDMYMVLNSVEHIREFTKRFDSLIRVAEISPDRAAQWVNNLKVK